MFTLFLSWDLEYTGLVTNFGPVPFIPWGTSRRVGRSKNIHNEKASTVHETLEVEVKDAVNQLLMCLVADPIQLDNLKELLEKVNSH